MLLFAQLMLRRNADLTDLNIVKKPLDPKIFNITSPHQNVEVHAGAANEQSM